MLILLSASGCLAIASAAFPVAIPIPTPAPIPVNTAIAAPIAIIVPVLSFTLLFFLYSISSFINNAVKNTNTYACKSPSNISK